ncbi:hypothetical protein [Streptomyces coryli]|nr:hypothetical protein [Streptomyces coryli]
MRFGSLLVAAGVVVAAGILVALNIEEEAVEEELAEDVPDQDA